MLLSYNWLKEYVENLPAPKELAERLTMSGTEVESVTEAGAAIKNVITAQVVSVEKHPNADRLKFCQVDTGKEVLGIVCGASNMKAGDKVVLALIGAELPGGFNIKKSKIRGIESNGMMCSEVELGLKDTSEGILILPEDAPLGADINEYLSLKDFMMEVGITPNRADLLSVKGLGREVSAVTGASFKDKEIKAVETGGPVDDLITVSIETDAPCGRYSARVIEGVKIGPSPDAMRRRLEAHGIRSINNVVDITNYVLLETGQPLHAFDLGKINNRTIDVRLAGEGETIETLDGKARALDPSMLVIADGAGPVALAGVMGGKGSEVSDSTVNILLESAWFEPSSVRRTSKKTGVSTDSSYRFERGVDIEGVTRALDMAAGMIASVAGGKIAQGSIDLYPNEYAAKPIEFRLKRAEALLGITLKEEIVAGIFKRLGIDHKAASGGVLTVLPPSYRGDIKIETDLVEEVARIYGYNNIPTTLPKADLSVAGRTKLFGVKRAVKDVLTGSGFLEVVNYSFVSREAFALTGAEGKVGVTLLNPLTEEQVMMRDSLMPSLFDNLRKNLQKKNEEVKIFEVAPVFIPEGKLPAEKWKVAGLMYGLRWEESWNLPKDGIDFFDVKGAVERLFEGLGSAEPLNVTQGDEPLLHPGKSAAIIINGKKAGFFGELHPDLKIRLELRRPAFIFEVDLDGLASISGEKKAYSAIPKFPESTRDIAFVVDENIPYGDIISAIKELDTKLIERVELFDVYYGGTILAGKRSLALRIVYRSMERTLTNQEVDEIHTAVAKELSQRFKAEVRGETRSV